MRGAPLHWAVWDELTTWWCHQCGYTLEEDEERETTCPLLSARLDEDGMIEHPTVSRAIRSALLALREAVSNS